MSMTPQEWFSQLPSFFRKKGEELSPNIERWLEDFQHQVANFSHGPSGLSVYEDDKYIYVEADMPGLTAKDIDVSVDSSGVLWIHGERHDEEKGKKYFRKSQQQFSYCVPLGNEVDTQVEPEAKSKNGVMKITFTKKKEKQTPSKKIKVKEE